MHSFENGCLQPRRLKRQHVDAIGCCTFLGGPISMFVLDIVQISVGALHPFAPSPPPPPATDLLTGATVLI
jgi:hypothetical protein